MDIVFTMNIAWVINENLALILNNSLPLDNYYYERYHDSPPPPPPPYSAVSYEYILQRNRCGTKQICITSEMRFWLYASLSLVPDKIYLSLKCLQIN